MQGALKFWRNLSVLRCLSYHQPRDFSAGITISYIIGYLCRIYNDSPCDDDADWLGARRHLRFMAAVGQSQEAQLISSFEYRALGILALVSIVKTQEQFVQSSEAINK